MKKKTKKITFKNGATIKLTGSGKEKFRGMQDATLRNVRAAKKRNAVLTTRVFELEVEVRKLKERVDSLEAVQEHLLERVK